MCFLGSQTLYRRQRTGKDRSAQSREGGQYYWLECVKKALLPLWTFRGMERFTETRERWNIGQLKRMCPVPVVAIVQRTLDSRHAEVGWACDDSTGIETLP